jgi:hypothetical protein
MKFFVFYSNKCYYCNNLLKTIQDEKLVDQCQLICFETDPEKIPDIITNVPTIIAKNLIKPLVGIETIEWIKNIKFFNQITNNIICNNVIDPNIVSALKDLEFNKYESSSISDHYTNISDSNIDKIMMDYDKININAPITNDVTSKKISDIKITDKLQQQKLKELILLRKHQLISKSSYISDIHFDK